VIVLDTHVLVWFAEDSPRLGARATKLADAALQRTEVIVSAISFWEIAMLAEKQRLALHVSPAAFRARVMEQGVREVAVSGPIGIAAVQLPDFHPDPADRIIVATATSVGAVLLTADATILRWRGSVRTHDARR
jgi:PIN domain nuclease of toxin-antitoxin system